MTEAQFTTKFKAWIKKNPPINSCAIEIKVTNGGTFNLRKWREDQGHQILGLARSVSADGQYHKISDQSSEKKPFDAFFLVNADAFLVIYFNKYKHFFVIPYYFLIAYLDMISISYKELSEKLIPHELPKKEVKVVPEF